jgi:hypothetical protein
MLLVATACLCAASIAACLFMSRRWGITQDTPLIHYVVFLISRGFAPYRDIIEMNMPGSYMTEWFAMHVFGTTDAAWRVFDIFLMALAALAAYRIVQPTGRVYAIIAAALITLYHVGSGTPDVGQRDYIVAVLLLWGAAFALDALHLQRPSLMFLAGISLAWSAAVKPTGVPFDLLLLLLVLLALQRRMLPIIPYIFWGFIGALIPSLAVLLFLMHFHALQPFLVLLHTLIPYHRSNGNLPIHILLFRWLYWMFYPLAIATLVLAFSWGRARILRVTLLTFGFLCGWFAYLYQGKGWTYHGSTAMLFLIVLTAVLAATSRRPRLAAVAIALASLAPALYFPVSIYRHSRFTNYALEQSLTNELNSLGGPALSHHVQCLDWNAGCLNVLYRMQLVQSTGFIYDYYLFPAHPAAATATQQTNFLAVVQAAPPRVIIITSHDWPAFQGFNKLDRWPQFEQWLNAHYTLADVLSERTPTPADIASNYANIRTYRVYTLR